MRPKTWDAVKNHRKFKAADPETQNKYRDKWLKETMAEFPNLKPGQKKELYDGVYKGAERPRSYLPEGGPLPEETEKTGGERGTLGEIADNLKHVPGWAAEFAGENAIQPSIKATEMMGKDAISMAKKALGKKDERPLAQEAIEGVSEYARKGARAVGNFIAGDNEQDNTRKLEGGLQGIQDSLYGGPFPGPQEKAPIESKEYPKVKEFYEGAIKPPGSLAMDFMNRTGATGSAVAGFIIGMKEAYKTGKISAPFARSYEAAATNLMGGEMLDASSVTKALFGKTLEEKFGVIGGTIANIIATGFMQPEVIGSIGASTVSKLRAIASKTVVGKDSPTATIKFIKETLNEQKKLLDEGFPGMDPHKLDEIEATTKILEKELNNIATGKAEKEFLKVKADKKKAAQAAEMEKTGERVQQIDRDLKLKKAEEKARQHTEQVKANKVKEKTKAKHEKLRSKQKEMQITAPPGEGAPTKATAGDLAAENLAASKKADYNNFPGKLKEVAQDIKKKAGVTMGETKKSTPKKTTRKKAKKAGIGKREMNKQHKAALEENKLRSKMHKGTDGKPKTIEKKGTDEIYKKVLKDEDVAFVSSDENFVTFNLGDATTSVKKSGFSKETVKKEIASTKKRFADKNTPIDYSVNSKTHAEKVKVPKKKTPEKKAIVKKTPEKKTTVTKKTPVESIDDLLNDLKKGDKELESTLKKAKPKSKGKGKGKGTTLGMGAGGLQDLYEKGIETLLKSEKGRKYLRKVTTILRKGGALEGDHLAFAKKTQELLKNPEQRENLYKGASAGLKITDRLDTAGVKNVNPQRGHMIYDPAHEPVNIQKGSVGKAVPRGNDIPDYIDTHLDPSGKRVYSQPKSREVGKKTLESDAAALQLKIGEKHPELAKLIRVNNATKGDRVGFKVKGVPRADEVMFPKTHITYGPKEYKFLDDGNWHLVKGIKNQRGTTTQRVTNPDLIKALSKAALKGATREDPRIIPFSRFEGKVRGTPITHVSPKKESWKLRTKEAEDIAEEIGDNIGAMGILDKDRLAKETIDYIEIGGGKYQLLGDGRWRQKTYIEPLAGPHKGKLIERPQSEWLEIDDSLGDKIDQVIGILKRNAEEAKVQAAIERHNPAGAAGRATAGRRLKRVFDDYFEDPVTKDWYRVHNQRNLPRGGLPQLVKVDAKERFDALDKAYRQVALTTKNFPGEEANLLKIGIPPDKVEIPQPAIQPGSILPSESHMTAYNWGKNGKRSKAAEDMSARIKAELADRRKIAANRAKQAGEGEDIPANKEKSSKLADDVIADNTKSGKLVDINVPPGERVGGTKGARLAPDPVDELIIPEKGQLDKAMKEFIDADDAYVAFKDSLKKRGGERTAADSQKLAIKRAAAENAYNKVSSLEKTIRAKEIHASGQTLGFGPTSYLQDVYEGWMRGFRERRKGKAFYENLDIPAWFGDNWRTGFAAKNMHSRKAQIQEEGLSAAREIQGLSAASDHLLMKRALTREELAYAAIVQNNPSYIKNFKGEQAARIKKGAEALQRFYDMGQARLKSYGVEVDYMGNLRQQYEGYNAAIDKMLADSTAHGGKFISYTKKELLDAGVNIPPNMLQVRKNSLDLLRAQKKMNADFIEYTHSLRYGHLPYNLWFADAYKLDPQNTLKVMRLATTRKRGTITIEDLLRKGPDGKSPIELEDVNALLNIASYSNKLGNDIALLDFVTAAKVEKLAIPIKEFNAYKKAGGAAWDYYKNFVQIDPRRAPILSGHRVSPRMADFIAEQQMYGNYSGWYEKMMTGTKGLAFSNPGFLPFYDLSQHAMLRTGDILSGNIKESYKIFEDVKEAYKMMRHRNAGYKRAQGNGTFSQPYDLPWDTWKESFEFLSKNPTEMWTGFKRHVADTAKEGYGFKGVPKLGYQGTKNAFKYAYKAAHESAWTGDRFVRLMTVNYLERNGFSPFEAAQTAAKFHSDYASVPAKTRRMLNRMLFTPTFKITMGKLYGNMIKNAVNPKSWMGLNGKEAQAFAKGGLGTAAIIFGMDQYLVNGLGYKRDQFGRKYVRMIEVDGMPQESVLSVSMPANMFLKYPYRTWAAFQPGTENKFLTALSMNKWELHPLLRASQEVATNKKGDGSMIWRPQIDSMPVIGAKIGLHYIKEIVRMTQMMMGDRPKQDLAIESLRKDLGYLHSKLVKWSPATFAYTRGRTSDSQYMRADSVDRQFMKSWNALMEKFDGEIPEKYDKSLDRLVDRMEALIDKADKTADEEEEWIQKHGVTEVSKYKPIKPPEYQQFISQGGT